MARPPAFPSRHQVETVRRASREAYESELLVINQDVLTRPTYELHGRYSSAIRYTLYSVCTAPSHRATAERSGESASFSTADVGKRIPQFANVPVRCFNKRDTATD